MKRRTKMLKTKMIQSFNCLMIDKNNKKEFSLAIMIFISFNCMIYFNNPYLFCLNFFIQKFYLFSIKNFGKPTFHII